jgi:hypothetical protein
MPLLTSIDLEDEADLGELLLRWARDWVLHATRGLGEVTRAPQDKIALEVRFEGAAAGERVFRNLIQPAEAPRAKERDHWQRLIQMQQLPADSSIQPQQGQGGLLLQSP